MKGELGLEESESFPEKVALEASSEGCVGV